MSIAGEVKSQFGMPWSKEEVEEVKKQMPGLGGFQPLANPYGLGLQIDLGRKYQEQPSQMDGLGNLEFFGYAQSSPYQLTMAYSNAGGDIERGAGVGNGDGDGDEWMDEEDAAV